MTNRSELRSFGANLVLGMDSLFWGGAFFIFLFRRAGTDAWKAAWDSAPGVRVPLVGALIALCLMPLMYRGRFWAGALLFGPVSALAIGSCLRFSNELALDSGSRAPVIAFGFFCAAFSAHILVLSVAGLGARGNPIFRRLLVSQAIFALLILPVVFAW